TAVLALLGVRPSNDGARIRGPEGRAKPGPADQRASLRTAFTRMVQSLCDDRLQVFAWDDAHSLDAATLGAVVATVERAEARVEAPHGLRAVFLFVTRGETPEVFAESPALHPLSLGELSDDDSAKLVSARVGARLIVPELLAFCRERA